MMSKIFLTVLLVVVIGIIVAVSSQDEEILDVETQISDNKEVLDTSSDLYPEDEYVIDESDMYSVAEVLSDNNLRTVTENEERWLILMREEEKLARDVYLTLGDMWGMQIFSNIATSEQTHTDAIKTLLERYELNDPVTDDSIGVFTDLNMQKLYADLITQGSESLLAALIVGATIEDLDIKDLDEAMAENSKSDIEIVYQNLQKGSRNHMRAFVRQIERNGGTYSPQYISVSDYESILSSSQERGRIE